MSLDAILKAAENQVDEVEISYSIGKSLSADLKKDHREIGSSSEGSGLIIRVIKDGKIGISSTNTVKSWHQCLNAAIASSRFSDPVDWKGLPKPVDINKDPLAFDSSIQADPELLTSLLERMLSGADNSSAEVTGGSVSISSVSQTLINSNDLFYEVPQTHISLSLEMIAGQSTGYEFDSSWSLSGLNPEQVGRQAAFLASHGQNGEEIATGSYSIVLSPMALSHLLEATIVPALSGRNVHTGRSIFSGKMGETVLDSSLSLIDDPIDPRGCGNCLWDGEGMPVQKTVFVQNGVLQSFAYDLKTAYRYGAQPTGHAVRTGMNGATGIGHHNLILNGDQMNVFDDDAIYINDLIGAHTANPLSGDFSVELSGSFKVSDGELGTPIRTGMLSGNVFDLLNNIEGCSKDTRTLGSLIVPTIRCTNMSIVGRG